MNNTLKGALAGIICTLVGCGPVEFEGGWQDHIPFCLDSSVVDAMPETEAIISDAGYDWHMASKQWFEDNPGTSRSKRLPGALISYIGDCPKEEGDGISSIYLENPPDAEWAARAPTQAPIRIQGLPWVAECDIQIRKTHLPIGWQVTMLTHELGHCYRGPEDVPHPENGVMRWKAQAPNLKVEQSDVSWVMSGLTEGE